MSTQSFSTEQAALDAICRTALDGVIAVDLDGIVVAFNDKAEATFGHRAADAMGASIVDLIFPERTRHICLSRIKDYTNNGGTASTGPNAEWDVVHANGHEFPLEARVSRLNSDEDAPFILFVRDLTDRRKRESEIGDAREKAHRATAAKSFVISMLAHDMRNAVGGVTGSLALLDQDMMGSREQEIITAVQSSAHQLRRLLDDTLDFVRMDAGEIDVTLAPVSVAQVVDELSETWTPRLEGLNSTLVLTCAQDAPDTVSTDIARLRQILGNLLSNAVKYAKGCDVAVTFSAFEENGLRIVVDDNGPGFSIEAVSTAFEPFLRPGDQQATGAGLGLSIVQTLTERLGGSVILGDAESGGARIELCFPDCQVAAAEQDHNALENLRFDGLAILLVEDNATNQLIASRFLEQLGCDVTVCGDGISGLETARDMGFDAIFMDIDLPGMNGTDVMRAIRRGEGPNQHAPLIAFTAFAIRAEREEIMKSGANTILAKPVSSRDDFAAALQTALARPGVASAPIKRNEDTVTLDPQRLNSLRETLGEEDFGELTSEFVSDLKSLREDLSSADGDGEAVRKATHVVIGVAGAIGALKAQAAAEDLNACAHTTAMEGIEDRIASLDSAIGETMAALGLLLEAS